MNSDFSKINKKSFRLEISSVFDLLYDYPLYPRPLYAWLVGLLYFFSKKVTFLL